MQLELQLHDAYRDEKLSKSIQPWISNRLVEWLQKTKEDIAIAKNEWNKVAVLHITADLLNSSHVQRINMAKAKLISLFWENVKLFVWVEADIVTTQRKNWKRNIYNEDERFYMLENMKSVDWAFISFSWAEWDNKEQRPYGTTLFLEPDVLVLHEEYAPTAEDWVPIDTVMKQYWWSLLRITEAEKEGLLWEKSFRHELWRSTTNTISQILRMYKWNKKYDI